MQHEITDLLDGKTVSRVFPDVAGLRAWADELDQHARQSGIDLHVAVDERHCAAVFYALEHKPSLAVTHQLLVAAANEFHTFYGAGACGVTEH